MVGKWTSFSFQGKTMKQGVFDGEVLWGVNMMTQKAEKSDAETTEIMKNESKDFPDAFLDYKEKGYSVELVGKEDFNGTETFKIKTDQNTGSHRWQRRGECVLLLLRRQKTSCPLPCSRRSNKARPKE